MGGRISKFAQALAVVACLAMAGCSRQDAKQKAAPEPEVADAGVVSEIVGFATVRDGSTIRVGPRRIRLSGIVTPREGAMCGDVNAYRAATDALRSATREHEVRCRITDLPDDTGRDIAQCRSGDVDVNAYMVEQGWARGADGAYAGQEAAARAAHRGVWARECAANLWNER